MTVIRAATSTSGGDGGFTKLTGVAGYPGNVSSSDSGVLTAVISATRERITNTSTPVWTVVDQIPLSRDDGAPFTEQLPTGVTGIQLTVSRDKCDTVVWGDPQVS